MRLLFKGVFYSRASYNSGNTVVASELNLIRSATVILVLAKKLCRKIISMMDKEEKNFGQL